MVAITITDLTNAKRDVDHIADIATSTGLSATDRLGRVKDTMTGVIANVQNAAAAVMANMGYEPPVAYAAGIALVRATQTVQYNGESYAPKLGNLPFTTSGTFETAKFRLIQGVSGADLAAPSGAGMVGYLQAGSGAVARTVQAKLRDDSTAKDFGAVGNGVANDVAALNAAKAAKPADPIAIPAGVYDIGTAAPDFNLQGAGVIRSNGLDAGRAAMSYNPARENIFYTPATYQREAKGETYPTRYGTGLENFSYNLVIANGSKLSDPTKTVVNTVAVGFWAGSQPISWKYIDAFGGNVMAYAANVERTTAVGSESLAWFGAPNVNWLRTYRHDWWRKPSDNLFEPGEVGWNGNGLETKFPGIGMRIGAFAGYATDSAQAGYTATLGRDAGNHIVQGVRNVFAGYQAAGHMFVGSYNVAVGALSLQNAVFTDYNSAFGDQAGRDSLDSPNATFVGYAAGRTVQKASFSTFLGDRAGDGFTVAERAVLIGSMAGIGETSANLSDKLIINNAPSTSFAPLLSGDFVTRKAGVNISPVNLRAFWHVRMSNSGSALAVNTGGDGLLIERGATTGLTIETPNNAFGNLYFADPESHNVGGITYGHTSNYLSFKANGSEKLRMEANGAVRPGADNAQTLGAANNRWSLVYAGTGSINTSDEREKQDIGAIDEAALRAVRKISFKQFRFRDAVAMKGDAARIHFGVIAQEVKAAFESEGVDPFKYGVLCYDAWEADEDRPAGNRYGVRYDELLCLKMASL